MKENNVLTVTERCCKIGLFLYRLVLHDFFCAPKHGAYNTDKIGNKHYIPQKLIGYYTFPHNEKKPKTLTAICTVLFLKILANY